MMLEFDNSVPGTLVTSRLASGNRGGLRLRIFGEYGGLEWDMEYCENLSIFLGSLIRYFHVESVTELVRLSRDWCEPAGAFGGSYRSVGKFIH